MVINFSELCPTFLDLKGFALKLLIEHSLDPSLDVDSNKKPDEHDNGQNTSVPERI